MSSKTIFESGYFEFDDNGELWYQTAFCSTCDNLDKEEAKKLYEAMKEYFDGDDNA